MAKEPLSAPELVSVGTLALDIIHRRGVPGKIATQAEDVLFESLSELRSRLKSTEVKNEGKSKQA